MKIIIDEYIENQRIDIYLSGILSNLSRSKIQSDIKSGSVLVNSKTVKPSYVLKINDTLEYFESDREPSAIVQAENIPLEIVWEDENMAVINKPSGMLTHPTTTETTGTLVNALLYKYGKEGLSDLNGDFRRGIVHRLDRNTSGLIMIAKNNKTHEFLVNEMKEKHFEKKYVAVAKGVLDKDSFDIDTPIGRHFTKPQKMAVNGKDSKESLSKVQVLKRFQEATLIEVTLVTGRTHQIRVHLSSIGHPVYNDTFYGFGKKKIKTDEQVLQSYKLTFTKPFTNERVFLEIPYNEKICKVLKSLEIMQNNLP